MKPTKIINLVIAAALGFAITFVSTKFSLANGGAVATVPPSLDVSLLATGVIEVLLAIPIFRFRRDLRSFAKNAKSANGQVKRIRRVDSFYAVRLLALVKSTAIFASLFLGFVIALLVSQLMLPVIPESIWRNVIAALVSIVLIVLALLIELVCKLPKPDAQGAAEANAETNPA
jgi:magnesium-transporting ATPase (P-type)